MDISIVGSETLVLFFMKSKVIFYKTHIILASNWYTFMYMKN